MKNKSAALMMCATLAGLFLTLGTGAHAQSSQEAANQESASPAKEARPAGGANVLEVPVAPEEESALKDFLAKPANDLDGKIGAGEDFIQKYPQSRSLSVVYSDLTIAYLRAGKPDKAFEIGDKEVQLRPDDVQTLAILSLTIPRAVSAKTPDPGKLLAKAENYAKRAIEVTPTLVKPEGLTDQNFVISKNATLAMAHGGLGLVYFRQGKFREAIPELEQSLKIDPNPTPDPTNLYALAMSDQKAAHFDAAAAAFARCATLGGSLQAICSEGAEQARKQSATQLSAPK